MATQHNTPICTCGDAEEHIVARRLTADRYNVMAWCSGAVTCGANGIPGVPVARPRTPEAWHRERAAMWLFVGEVELYDGVDVTAEPFGVPLNARPVEPYVARASWTVAPGSMLDSLLALHDPEPRRARNFDGRLAWLTRKHAAERRVIREWLSRAWDGSWQRGAPLPLP